MNSTQKKELYEKLLLPENFQPILDKTFKEADTDGSGYIEKNEYVLLCHQIADGLGIPRPTFEEIDNGLNSLDKNKDGKLSKEEFTQLVKFLLKVLVERM